MNKQKGFAPILIVIIIAALVGGYLIYQNQTKPTPPPTTQLTSAPTPTPESTNSAETANWKTYTDAENGFSISYPGEFAVNKIGGGVSFQKNNTNRAILFLQVNDNKGNLTAREFFNNQPDQMKKPMEDANQITDYQLNGSQGLMFTKKESADGYKDFAVSLSHNNHIYSLNFGPKENEFNLANQILSTFKFLP